MKTKTELVALATCKTPSSSIGLSYVGVGRAELLAALGEAANEQAAALRAGAENSGANSTLYVVREQLLEALADEPAVV